MAKTDGQFIDLLRQIEIKKKEIKALNNQRQIDENNLNETYRVDEVNSLKNNLAVTHANAVALILNEINVLQDALIV